MDLINKYGSQGNPVLKRAVVRSSIFNLLFYFLTAIACIICLPTLLLPRIVFLTVVRAYHYMIVVLEYGILGLRYEVRGKEHLPENGAYLVAAKHMSPYETLKLRLLFDDPAIVLKKELLSIPLWGRFLKKSCVIAIDRSTPDRAMESLREGALEMKDRGRPIVIFPQGTRVWPHETPLEKRYKSGVARIQETTGLPIIPTATNSGLFWPRTGWLKSPGTVVFQFLEPIMPGPDKETVMKDLQERLEETSRDLMDEAIEHSARRQSKRYVFIGVFVALFLVLFGFYSVAWFEMAKAVKQEYQAVVEQIGNTDYADTAMVNGYPGPVRLHVPYTELTTPDAHITIENLDLKVWPVFKTPSTLVMGPIQVIVPEYSQSPLSFDGFEARSTITADRVMTLSETHLRADDFVAHMNGTVDLDAEPVPIPDLILHLENYSALLQRLTTMGIMKQKEAFLVSAGLSLFADERGMLTIPIHRKGDMIFAGPFPAYSLLSK